MTYGVSGLAINPSDSRTLNVFWCLFSPAGYAGTTNTTLSGRRCQRWDSQSPHIHPYSSLSAFENNCRNPNDDAGAWCYTTDKRRRTEFCLPPVVNCKFFPIAIRFRLLLTLASISGWTGGHAPPPLCSRGYQILRL